MKPTLFWAAAPVPAQVVGVVAGYGWSTPPETPRKLSLLATPLATTTAPDGLPHEFETIGVPQT